MCMKDLQYMYVVCSVPICTVILFTVVHRSNQREFMFVVNKGVFFSFAQCCEQITVELQRASVLYSITVPHYVNTVM